MMSNGPRQFDLAHTETIPDEALDSYIAYLENLSRPQSVQASANVSPDMAANNPITGGPTHDAAEKPQSRLPEGVVPYIDNRKLPVPWWALVGGVSILGFGAKVAVDYLESVEPQNLSAGAIGVGIAGMAFFGLSEKFDKIFPNFRRKASMSDGEGVSNGHITRRTVARISGALGLTMVVAGVANGGAAFYQEQLVDTVSWAYNKAGSNDDKSEGDSDNEQQVSVSMGCESAEYIRCEIDANGKVRRIFDYVASIESTGEYSCSEVGEPIYLSIERSSNNNLNNPWGGLVYDRGTDPSDAEAIREKGLLDLGGTLNRQNYMLVGKCAPVQQPEQ